MKVSETTPMWVQLAWGNVGARKIAVWMIVFCVLFMLYCIPWTQFSSHPVVAKLSLINDWYWAGSMLPLTIWYWLSLKWVDRHNAWES